MKIKYFVIFLFFEINDINLRNRIFPKSSPNINIVNTVFIAACCPYRQAEKNLMKNIGLKVEEAHKQLKKLNQKEIDIMKKSTNSNLVYNVNPLPHSLLNFVLNFGNLTEEDEKK